MHQADAVSVATSFDYALPLEQQIPLIAESGFTHFSLGADVGHSEYLAAAGQRRLRRLAEAHGLGDHDDTFDRERPTALPRARPSASGRAVSGDPDNVVSIRVARRAGFHRAGTAQTEAGRLLRFVKDLE